jgi:hypothetical protein
MTWRLRAGVLIVAVLASGAGEAQTSERRQHFAVNDQASGLAYRITKIDQTPNETETREIFLVEDVAVGDRFIVTDRRDYLNQTREVEVADVELKEKAIATIQFPFKSATRVDTIDEMRAAKKAGTLPQNLPVTIDINGVSVAASETEWTSDRSRDNRSKVRRAASSAFLDRLERLRPILGSHGELSNVCRFLLALVLNHEPCRGPVKFDVAQPDCEFDSSFRYGCSDAQKRRIAKARQSEKVLTSY